ncbi:MAG: hypothetical protein GF349_01885 [Candidatus Magasanikbacteria bacterium]|nr:hypothetical protein [Candidatus Magasanikbacteria bacterium]
MNDVIKLGKKAFTWSVVVMTIVWSVGLSALVPAGQVNAAVDPADVSSGDLIKLEGSSAVYQVTTDMERMFHTNSEFFHTWYANFDGVKELAAGTDLDALFPPADPGAVAPRPGSLLLKTTASPRVYAIECGNVRRHLADEAAAVALYGDNWANLVRDVPDYIMSLYTLGDELDGTMPHCGMVVLVEGMDDPMYVAEDGMKYEIDGTLPDYVMDTSRTVSQDVYDAIETGDGSVTAASITEDPSQMGVDTTTPVTDTGSVYVALSSNNPATSILPPGAEADLLIFNMTAGTDGASITSMTVQRSGLATKDAVDELTVYVDGTKYGNTKTSWNSDKEMTFNFPNPIEIDANDTVEVTLRAQIGTTSPGSYAAVLLAEADDIRGVATVTGSFPISGNLMNLATDITAGSLTLENAGTGGDVTHNFGDDDVNFADFDLTAGSSEDVLLTGVTFENGGTADTTAANNYKLYVDGAEVAEGVVSGDLVSFSFDAVTIEAGDTANVVMRGDMVNGEVDQTMKFFVYDITAVGKDLGYAAGATITDLDKSTDTAVNVITLAAGDITLNFDKDATPAKDVRIDTNNVVLGTLEITSNDEAVTINSISHTDTTAEFVIEGTNLDADGEIENVELHEVGGGVYDLTATYDAGDDQYELQLDDEIYLPKGETKTFEFVVDFTSTADDGDKLRVVVDGDAFDHEGETSGSTSLTFTPNNVTSAYTTVKKSYLTITNTALTNKTVVGGSTDVQVYEGKLSAGTSSDIKITEIVFNTYDASSDNEDTLFSDTNISQLRLYINGVMVKAKSGSITEAANDTSDGSMTFSALNTTIPSGDTYTVKIEADFASNLSGTGEFALSIPTAASVTARDQDNELLTSSNKNTVTEIESREVTLAATGDLLVDMQTDGTNWNRDLYLLAGNGYAEDRYAGELYFRAKNEDVLVEDLYLEVTSTTNATEDDIESISLVDGDGVVVMTEAFVSPTTTFDNLDYVVEAESSQSLYILINAKGSNVDGDPSSTATAGRSISLMIYNVVARGQDTGDSISMSSGSDSPAFGSYDHVRDTVSSTIMTSVLSSAVNAMSDGTLTGGNGKTVGKYTFTFDNADNRNSDNTVATTTLTTLVLNFASSTNVRADNVQAYIEGDSTNKTTAVSVDSNGEATINLTTLSGDSEQVTGVVTLVITADVTTSASDGEYLQTEIDDLSTDFTWVGGVSNGGDSKLKISEVIGGTLSE